MVGAVEIESYPTHLTPCKTLALQPPYWDNCYKHYKWRPAPSHSRPSFGAALFVLMYHMRYVERR
jgi:hypothetical protein